MSAVDTSNSMDVTRRKHQSRNEEKLYGKERERESERRGELSVKVSLTVRAKRESWQCNTSGQCFFSFFKLYSLFVFRSESNDLGHTAAMCMKSPVVESSAKISKGH